MNRIEEFQSRATEQSRSVFGYVADLMECGYRRNLKLAEAFANFSVAQVRVPVQSKDFSSYREGLTEAYGNFGEALRTYREGGVERMMQIPSEFVELFRTNIPASEESPTSETVKAGKAAAGKSAKAEKSA